MRFVAFAAVLIGALSIVLMVKSVFGTDIVPLLQSLLTFYDDQIIGFVLHWAEPFIRDLLQWLMQLTGLHLTLLSHWKHVTVLMALYFTRDAFVMFEFAWNGAIRPDIPGAFIDYNVSATLRLLFGVVMASVAGIGTGVIALEQPDFFADVLFVGIPVLCVWMYWIFTAWLGAIFHREHFAEISGIPAKSRNEEWVDRRDTATNRAAAGGGVALILITIIDGAAPAWLAQKGAAVVVLGILVIWLGSYWWWRGSRESKSLQERLGISEIESQALSRNLKLGQKMLSVVVCAVLFLAVNAVLQ